MQCGLGLEGHTHSTEVSCLALQRLDSLNLFTILCMVNGKRKTQILFSLALRNLIYFNCLTILLWHLGQISEQWTIFAWKAPFIPKHDTYYQFTC